MAAVSAAWGVLACLLLTALTSRGQGVGAPAESVLETLVQNLAADVSKLEARVTQLEDSRTRRVAFSAYLAGDDVDAVRDQIVIFGGVIDNVGNAYNATSGVFTAPYDGDYFFILNVDVSEDYEDMLVNRNGNTVFEADKDDWASTHASGSAVVSLVAGDVITVTHYTSRGSVDKGKETTFSGFLIQ